MKLKSLLLESQNRRILSEHGVTLQGIKRSIREEEMPAGITDTDLEAAIADVLKRASHSDKEISTDVDIQQAEKEVNEQQLNEGLTIALLLMAPAIIKLISKITEAANRKFNLSADEQAEIKAKAQELKNTKDPHAAAVFSSGLAKKLDQVSHALHKVYTYPIRVVLKGLALAGVKKLQDKKLREKIADVIYAVVMLFYGGYHAVHGVQGLLGHHGLTELPNAILDTWKSGKSLTDIVKVALESLNIGDLSA